MVPKALLGGVIGFLIGGLVVSTTYTLTKDELKPTTVEHNQQTFENLSRLTGEDFDRAFLEEMIAHHQGAIDMARLTQSNASHEELKKLGQDILTAQSKEIDLMQTWQGEWGYKTVPKSHDANTAH